MCMESNSAPLRTSITIRSSWLSSQALSVAASMDWGADSVVEVLFEEVIISFGIAWAVLAAARGCGRPPSTGLASGWAQSGQVEARAAHGGRRRPGSSWGESASGQPGVSPLEHPAGHRVGGEAGGGELVGGCGAAAAAAAHGNHRARLIQLVEPIPQLTQGDVPGARDHACGDLIGFADVHDLCVAAVLELFVELLGGNVHELRTFQEAVGRGMWPIQPSTIYPQGYCGSKLAALRRAGRKRPGAARGQRRACLRRIPPGVYI